MGSLDDLAIYVFVRQDLSEQDQRIQLAHAVAKLRLVWKPAEANYKIIELDGGATEKAFNRTVRTMPTRGVAHIVYSDSDHPEWGPTAIATVPSPQGVLPHKLRRSDEWRAEMLLSSLESHGLVRPPGLSMYRKIKISLCKNVYLVISPISTRRDSRAGEPRSLELKVLQSVSAADCGADVVQDNSLLFQ